ncbi:unnamed protein product [Rhizoctonia solani]|uniref:BTB domain-containing protein n=1 Tax=Rhizoctonia solani TaxID=456999 RepID=A0A8H3BHY7_9AGAM|nr:unnamed protein product [Rhizoctonia solani]
MNKLDKDSGTTKQCKETCGTSNNNSSNNAPQAVLKSLNTKPSLVELCTPSTVHDLTGACINLQVNTVVIKTHEFQIANFVYLYKLIKKARLVDPQNAALTIRVTGGNELVSDFLNTFKILGTSPVDKSDNFDTDILVSAARISAQYEHPALRAFCIKRLEGLSLDSMERLRIARALDLKSWEERAYQELAERDGTITKEEALTLKIDAYWQVANAREAQAKLGPRNYTYEMLFICLGMLYYCVIGF